MSAQGDDTFCVGHKELKLDVREIKAVQLGRHCISHDIQITHAINNIKRLQEVDEVQWTAINNLRRLVYIGMGGVSVAAFFGSLVGQFLISMFGKR